MFAFLYNLTALDSDNIALVLCNAAKSNIYIQTFKWTYGFLPNQALIKY